MRNISKLHFCISLFFLWLVLQPNISKAQSYLSNLEAGSHFPLYTTYAAAKERSNYILDEGYQFVFNDSTKGANFRTDTGGQIGIAFKQGHDVVYKLSEMYIQPVITKSYPDLVSYFYYPFKGIRVETEFLVKSSTVALWDLKVFNDSNRLRPVSVFPFIRKYKRVFDNINVSLDSTVIYFSHNEYPDNWTINHNLPYVSDINDALVLSVQPQNVGIFNSFHGESNLPPSDVYLKQKPDYQIQGRAYIKDGKRIIKQNPDVRFQVTLNNNDQELITENSPIWGSSESSINNDGFFRAELGLFRSEKDSYSFTYYDVNKELVSRYSKKIINKKKPSHRRDVTLHEYDLPPVPQKVNVQKNEDGDSIIRWNAESNLSYRVYRRSYPAPTYKLIAEDLITGKYLDRNVSKDSTYGYVIVSRNPESGELSIHSSEEVNRSKSSFNNFLRGKSSGNTESDWASVISFKKTWRLKPGQKEHLRLIRTVDSTKNNDRTAGKIKKALEEDLDSYTAANKKLFSNAPQISFHDPDKQALYWSANNMMRQVFYPPEGKSDYNYYVFSREPTWGWGHGGQVFHESITMLSYAYLDPESAMNSQRVYSSRQYDNGYINYRTGSYLDEIIKYNGQLTSSAPWYSWINWEVYKITQDRKFLKEMYASSKKFYEFYTSRRDSDGDGLAEWGGHAVLESVRDALVAVWDEVGWPANFESVGLNCMLVKEAKSLEQMALVLGRNDEADQWKADYQQRTKLINETLWDSSRGFYYNVDKKDNDFTYKKPDDLKRDEIIGFLPLWAGVASKDQAKQLVKKLTNPDKFWRKYGIPSLAADDSYYNDKGYWNGPVWVEWNYLIMRGLLDYGYDKQAKELVNKISKAMIIQLKKNHNLWEFYSPDDEWAGYHRTYIWAGIINRMLIDTYDIKN